MSGRFPKIVAAAFAVFIVAALFLLGRSLACGLAAGARWCSWWPHLSLSTLENVIVDSGRWAVVVSVGLMVVHSLVPFPAEFIAIANGMIFGPLRGTAITWAGAMIGASLSFYLARALGRPFVLRLLSPAQERRLEQWVDRLGPDSLLIGRLIPVISFNLLNYGAGLTPIPWWTFLWTTGLGILPVTVLMVLAGEQVHRMPLFLWLSVLGAGLLLWAALYRPIVAAARKAGRRV